jgi:hypothetical protein
MDFMILINITMGDLFFTCLFSGCTSFAGSWRMEDGQASITVQNQLGH